MKTFADFGVETHGQLGEFDTTCPQCSPTRKKKSAKCLSVNTDKGVWYCAHCGWAGTVNQGEHTKPNPTQWRRTEYTKPQYKALTDLPEKVISWFKARGISEGVLSRNKIGYGEAYMPQLEEHAGCIQFPYYRAGELINIKFRDGQKNFRMVGGAERVLYGIDDIESSTIIVEGEIDKLSFDEAGFKNCISVPDGAPTPNTKDYASKFNFLNSAEEVLGKVKTFYIAVDNDEPGKRLEEELTRRLGRERCMKVTFPDGCKDANDVLVKMGREMLSFAILHAKAYPISGVYEVADISDSIDLVFMNGFPKGNSSGWKRVDQHYTIQAGQMTIVTGIPSHGKSEFLDAMTVNLAKDHDWVFGMFSPENQPIEFHAAKLIEKFAGRRFGSATMGQATYENGKKFVHDHYAFILPEQDVTLDLILEKAKALVFRRGIRGLVIDPWNEIEHKRPDGMNETEYISQALTKIRQFARQNDIHIWVVAHPTKLLKDKDGNYPVPSPYDISGSANWRNKADNCIAVWRDVQNEDRPVEIHFQKVRFRWIGKPGKVELFYDYNSGRYTETASPIYSMVGDEIAI